MRFLKGLSPSSARADPVVFATILRMNLCAGVNLAIKLEKKRNFHFCDNYMNLKQGIFAATAKTVYK